MSMNQLNQKYKLMVELHNMLHTLTVIVNKRTYLVKSIDVNGHYFPVKIACIMDEKRELSKMYN